MLTIAERRGWRKAPVTAGGDNAANLHAVIEDFHRRARFRRAGEGLAARRWSIRHWRQAWRHSDVIHNAAQHRLAGGGAVSMVRLKVADGAFECTRRIRRLEL